MVIAADSDGDDNADGGDKDRAAGRCSREAVMIGMMMQKTIIMHEDIYDSQKCYERIDRCPQQLYLDPRWRWIERAIRESEEQDNYVEKKMSLVFVSSSWEAPQTAPRAAPPTGCGEALLSQILQVSRDDFTKGRWTQMEITVKCSLGNLSSADTGAAQRRQVVTTQEVKADRHPRPTSVSSTDNRHQEERKKWPPCSWHTTSEKATKKAALEKKKVRISGV